MRGGLAILTITGIVDHQHPLRMRRSRWIGHQYLKAAGVDPFMIPAGLGEEEL